MTIIIPTQHEKDEWSRMSQAAFAAGLYAISDRYNLAAGLPRGDQLMIAHYDQLQCGYRSWLVDGVFPVE